MTNVIDRRDHSSATTVSSRQRFLDRYKGYAKKAVEKAIASGNVTDIGRGGVDVNVPKGDLHEPTIHHGNGGIKHRVLPGNKEYQAGDRIPKPRGGGGGGGGGNGDGAGQDGSGDDDFVFHISEEEFLNYMFADLELPNLTKKGGTDIEQTKPKFAGIVSSGPFNKIDYARSRRKKMGRVFAAERPYNDRILDLLKEEIDILSGYNPENSTLDIDLDGPVAANDDAGWRVQKDRTWMSRKQKIRQAEGQVVRLKDLFAAQVSPEHHARLDEIDHEIDGLRAKKSAIPSWNESTDLRFRFHAPQPRPTSKAVMFCLMDVSGSMDQEKKNNAKIFYLLLYRFLQRHYEKTEIVFIRHHTQAAEVNEKDFFYGTETGGTIVSVVLEEMQKIMKERYADKDWNVYGAQASDGDNVNSDNPKCAVLLKDILKDVQGYFYTEITQGRQQGLWDTYEKLSKEHSDRFWMGKIRQRKDIWPLFREFFQKRESFEHGQAAAAAFAYNR